MNTKLFRAIRLTCSASANMFTSKTFTRIGAGTLFAAAMISVYGALATRAHGLPSNQRVNLGPEDESAPVAVTVWLKLRNEAALDAMVKQLYDKSSPNYHHWLTPAQYQSQFAPTTQDTVAVANFLAGYNLKVVAADPSNHFVKAEGRVADAQRAFNTQINRVMVNGQVHRVAASEAKVAGSAAALVEAVQGLSDLGGYRTNVTPSKNPDTTLPYDGVSPSSPGSNGLFFSADCLRGVQTVTFTTKGGLPKAIYTGNRYGADIMHPQPPNLPPCGYDAEEVQTAYGLKPLIQSGLDGTGQTIVIVDAFGSNTILADANVFSALNGLPPLRKSGPNANFKILEPTGPTHCGAKNGCIAGNWQFETTLDVEWAHAVAPGAKIVLVLAADNSFVNLDAANHFAIQNQLGSVLSNSFGIPEIVLVQLAPAELNLENRLAKLAAAMGISQNVSTGDSGDNLAVDTADFGLPVTSSGANDSPFVTTVGGTSTFLNRNHSIKLQTGWGLNLTRIADPHPNPPTIPPLLFGFQEGAGGGTSGYFSKPAYQNQLPGNLRKTPDIAMNADPETGNEIIVTPDSVPGHPQTVAVFGGTSLSTPMFSAFWAIANQAAANNGHRGLLGQAAPILYQLSGSAILDVYVPLWATQNNVTGTIYKHSVTEHLGADSLANPQEPDANQYISALFHSPTSTRWDVFTFGTDSSLFTQPGWDSVTGLGTPNGPSFVQAVVAAAH
jgi:subtilase family serine protease